jgi:adenylate cyclase
VLHTPLVEPTSSHALFGQRPGWPLQPVVNWILAEGRLIASPAKLYEGLINALRAAGAPVDRGTVGVATLHPQIGSWWVYWDSRQKRVDHGRRERGVTMTDQYIGSPVQAVREHGATVRRRLHDVGPNDHGTFHDLVAVGLTDYLGLPMMFSDGNCNFLSFATHQDGGFTDDDIIKLSTLPIWLGPIFEAIEQRNVAITLLNTYVGSQTGQQILQGLIKRGDGETIRAAIWYSDLRDFTGINERLSSEEVLAMLNAYFEFVAAAVTARGGEILQFIGDAILVMSDRPTRSLGSFAMKGIAEPQEVFGLVDGPE